MNTALKTLSFVLPTGVALVIGACPSAFGTPINLVQNGSFAQQGAGWNGNSAAWLNGWSTVPTGSCVLLTDIYQNVPTTPGQLYSVSFYAAADLYFGSSVDFAVNLNSLLLTSIITPPYAYNSQVNRYEQMHWAEYTYLFTATANSTRLEFVDQSTPYFGLTDVRIYQSVPDTAGTIALCGISGLALGAFVKLAGRSCSRKTA